MIRLRRASRPAESVTGFVVATGSSWTLFARTMDGGYFDGHIAIRIADIAHVRPDTSFESAFAKTRPDWPPAIPTWVTSIDLDSTKGMLRSFLHRGHLVGIERDKKYDAIWIGVPDELLGKWLYLWEVTPKAKWEDRPLGYKLRSVTTVIIGSHYQTGLAEIAGDPPEQAGEFWPTRPGKS